jgi:hypothetical protein
MGPDFMKQWLQSELPVDPGSEDFPVEERKANNLNKLKCKGVILVAGEQTPWCAKCDAPTRYCGPKNRYVRCPKCNLIQCPYLA